MGQNLITLAFNDAELAAIDAALSTLETQLGALIDLHAEQRRSLPKMGDKSEAFCRQTLTLLSLNPQLVPPGLGLDQAERDLVALDALRSRTHRLQRLTGRAEDSEIALGSDIMRVSLEGYALLKRMGRGSGLETLRQDLGAPCAPLRAACPELRARHTEIKAACAELRAPHAELGARRMQRRGAWGRLGDWRTRLGARPLRPGVGATRQNAPPFGRPPVVPRITACDERHNLTPPFTSHAAIPSCHPGRSS